jgi:hypothetical protein
MTDGAVRQDGPKLVVDELGHLFAQEGGVLFGGAVATPLDVGVGPRFGRGEHGHSLVPPFTQLVGQVRVAAKIFDEVCPGPGGIQVTS